MKILILVLTGVATLAVLAGIGFWWLKQMPMYRLGQAAAQNLKPGVVTNDGRWRFEDGIELKHFSTGEGRNIIYVHGGPGIPPQTSIPAFDALASNYKVTYYHQRGTGESTRPFDDIVWEGGAWPNIQRLEGTLGIASQLADIERIRLTLKDEAIILIGHSYGGLLAALYAAEFPQNVAQLVLIAPADLLVFPSTEGGLFEGIAKNLPSDQASAYAAWQSEYFDLGSIFSKSTQDLEALDAQFVDYFAEMLKEVTEDANGEIGVWQVRAQYFGLGQRHDWRKEISAYKGPALILHGKNDLQSIAVSELYADAFSDAVVTTIENAGHFPHYSQPQATAESIQNFLTSNPRTE